MFDPDHLAVYVRDPAADRVAQVDDIASLDVRLRFNDVGTWVLTSAPDSLLNLATQPGWGIEIVRDTVPLVSGPMTRRQRTLNSGGNTIVVSGEDDNTWLGRRNAMPSPATAAPPYPTAYDVRTGICSTILLQYANVNAGPAALTVRQVPGFTPGTDLALGSSLTGKARFQPLLKLLTDLAVQGGGLGFRVVQDAISGALTFNVYQPRDLTGSVVLDLDYGNLAGFAYDGAAPTANYVVCGGKGEELTRPIREGGSGASVVQWGRIETFIDKRDSTSNADLDAAIVQKVAEATEQTSLNVTPIETPYQTYGVHYQLGDKITANIDGAQVADVITEVAIHVDGDSETLTPTVGAPTKAGLSALFAAFRASNRRLNDLERV